MGRERHLFHGRSIPEAPGISSPGLWILPGFYHTGLPSVYRFHQGAAPRICQKTRRAASSAGGALGHPETEDEKALRRHEAPGGDRAGHVKRPADPDPGRTHRGTGPQRTHPLPESHQRDRGQKAGPSVHPYRFGHRIHRRRDPSDEGWETDAYRHHAGADRLHAGTGVALHRPKGAAGSLSAALSGVQYPEYCGRRRTADPVRILPHGRSGAGTGHAGGCIFISFWRKGRCGP